MKLILASDVGLANDIVSMSTVCTAIGMTDVEYASSGAKTDCPFATLFHPGGGKSFRIYDDKTAYCYACAEHWRPVQLYAQAKDVSLDDAAEQLLDLVGYKKPTAESRFEEARANSFRVDQNALVEALKLFCARTFPSWDIDQFEPKIAHKFRQAVELTPNIRTAEESRTWLSAAKTAMTRVIGEHTHD